MSSAKEEDLFEPATEISKAKKEDKPIKDTKEEKKQDLVAEFTAILREYTDAPEEHIQAAGYALISATMGQYYRTLMLPNKGRPNLWMIPCSFPGRMRRSSVLGAVEYVYKKVMREVKRIEFEENSSLHKVKEEGEKELSPEEELDNAVEDLLIESGTPEGIIDHTENSKSMAFHLDSGEFGDVLLRMQGDGYEKSGGVLLSKMYYGEGGSQDLSQRGGKKGKRTLRSDLYVTLFCGMQEPWLYITLPAVRQGLPRRILFIFVAKNLRYKAPISNSRYFYYPALDKFSTMLLEQTLKARKLALKNKQSDFGMPLIQVTFYPNVIKAINEYDTGITAKVDKDPSIFNLITQSFWEMLAKLAMCRQIGKDDIHVENGVNTLIVGEKTYAEAEEFLNKIYESYKLFANRIGEKVAVPVNVQSPQDLLYYYIQSHMPIGVTLTEITKKFRWNSREETWPRLNELNDMEVIEPKEEVTGGRSAIRYKTTGKPYP